MEQIVFAIDNGSDPHVRMKFLKSMDILRAMGKIEPVVTCIGMWEGQLECSYMMPAWAFDVHVVPHGWVDKQVCILRVPSDVRQPCVLDYGDHRESVGRMVTLKASDLNTARGWTYVEETGAYFTTEKAILDTDDMVGKRYRYDKPRAGDEYSFTGRTGIVISTEGNNSVFFQLDGDTVSYYVYKDELTEV